MITEVYILHEFSSKILCHNGGRRRTYGGHPRDSSFRFENPRTESIGTILRVLRAERMGQFRAVERRFVPWLMGTYKGAPPSRQHKALRISRRLWLAHITKGRAMRTRCQRPKGNLSRSHLFEANVRTFLGSMLQTCHSAVSRKDLSLRVALES